MTFVLVVLVCRPLGHCTDFIKEFADFLTELVLAADQVLIVGDFNIHVDNEKYVLGSAFIDILKSIGVRQHMLGPTHCNHTLDLILILSTLHWLTIEHWIHFKILIITYKALNGLAPQYLSELISHYSHSRPLQSQNSGHLTIPRISKSTAGGTSSSY